MKLDDKKRDVYSNTLDDASFSMSVEDQVHILSILRDKTYSDKVLAVIREYSTNAIDAHADAGKEDHPISVHLPTEEDCVFRVRDYGQGLTDDEIKNVYIRYGASTKRNSNSVIGQLGIGCKSAFAYTDLFIITSYIDGYKNIYHAFIDESGMGKISRVSSELSYKPTGIEIEVPVKSTDIYEFREKAKRLFNHFKIKPNLNIDLDFDQDILFSGEFWHIYDPPIYQTRRSVAVMGNISYPINYDSLKNHPDFNLPVYESIALGAIIYFDIGELSISASRENLEYTQQTQKNIIRKLKAVHSEFFNIIQEKVDNTQSHWEAARLLNEYKNIFRSNSSVIFPTTKCDVNIKRSTKEFSDYEKAHYKDFCGGARRPLYVRKEYRSFDAILINDVSRAPVSRAETLLHQNNYVGSLIYGDKKKSKEELLTSVESFIDRHSLRGIPVHWLSEIPYQSPQSQTTSQANTNSIAKANNYLFAFDRDDLQTHKGWKPVDSDIFNEENIIYIPINRFKPYKCNLSSNDSYYLKIMIQNIEDLTSNTLTLYGVKKSKLDKVPDTWIRFDHFIKQVYAGFWKKNKSKILYLELQRELVSSIFRSFGLRSQFEDTEIPEHFKKNASLLSRLYYSVRYSDSVKFEETCNKWQSKVHTWKILYQNNSTCEENKEYSKHKNDIRNFIDYIKEKRYPLLKYVNIYNGSINEVLKYTKMIDTYEKEEHSISYD